MAANKPAAVVTNAGTLFAKQVIHAPTMEQPGMKIGVENVRRATRAALLAAARTNIDLIAIPGMGTGLGGVDPSVLPAQSKPRHLRHGRRQLHASRASANQDEPHRALAFVLVIGRIRQFIGAEDLRADRQMEFTQIDVEASFIDREGIYAGADHSGEQHLRAGTGVRPYWRDSG